MSTKRRSRSHRRSAPANPRERHNRWIAWVAVVLMLAAMAMYVLSLDEALLP